MCSTAASTSARRAPSQRRLSERQTEMNQSASSSELAQFLLAPRSLAIVGQSNDAGKTAGRPLKYLRQAGYGGRLYPINPGRKAVLGERAWPSLAALPEVPEHVYVVTPTDPSVDAVAEAGRLGVKVPTLTAISCFSKPCATPRRCDGLRLRRPSAANRSWPISSAARQRRASSRSPTPAHLRARTMLRTPFSPPAASRALTRSRACSKA